MWGEIIGGALGLAGSLFGAEEENDAAQDLQQMNAQLQKDFAQQGIRWRVEDAKAAGVHPLFALGAQLPTFSPVSTQFASGPNWASHGQDIGRAIEAAITAKEKEKSKLEQLQEERGELENQLLRARLAKELAAPTIPTPSLEGGSMPSAIPGQEHGARRAGLVGVKVKPAEVTATQSGRPTQEAGAIPGVRWERTPGGFRPHPSSDLGIDDFDLTNLQALEWMMQNRLLPGREGMEPPARFLPPGAVGWRWSWYRQEYQPVFPGKTYDRATDPGALFPH